MASEKRILIVGAGPTGLTAAVELARLGHIPVVIEKRTKASNLSRAVGILPSSMKILTPSGVADKIKSEGIAFRNLIFHKGDKQLGFLKLNEIKDPKMRIFGLAQDRTEAHLAKAFKDMGGKINYGAELLSLSQSQSGVSVSILGKAFRFDYVIGADGVQSAVRKAVGIKYAGIDLPETWSIADVDAKSWKHSRALQGFVIDGGGVLIVAPLEANRYRVVANRPNALANLPIPMNVTNIRRQGKFTISVKQAETYQKGRVFLAGDAAHCHSPVGGRGMNLGIADAAELARCIHEDRTEEYTEIRHGAGQKAMELSERGRKFLTSTHPVKKTIFRGFYWLACHSPTFRRVVVKRLLDL